MMSFSEWLIGEGFGGDCAVLAGLGTGGALRWGFEFDKPREWRLDY